MIDLRHGDCLEVMRTLADNSVDSVVTDPPYHLTNNGGGPHGKGLGNAYARAGAGASSGGFMGKTWDGGDIAFQPATWVEAMRVLKPGGFLLAFSGTRTYHRMACAIEDAGFEIRDQIGWTYGSGFPKSHNGPWGGTALKPAWEPICVARKPLIGTVEQNWKEHGTGALNIDGCRIQTDEALRTGAGGIPCRHDEHTPRGRTDEPSANSRYASEGGTDFAMTPGPRGGDAKGRWPANLIHDGSDEVVALFPQSAGQSGAVTGDEPTGNGFSGVVYGHGGVSKRPPATPRNDTGSAARFFYCAKADRADRNEGLYGFDAQQQDAGRKPGKPGGDNPRNRGVHERQNHHPTVKPTDLMRYLCRLVTPPGGLVLDPFMGSGSTGRAALLEGFRFIGIEREADYIAIARARIDSARRQGHQPSLDLEAA